ncbi:MAG: DNA-processing protein DprA, partial [Propioniciclava sp.]
MAALDERTARMGLACVVEPGDPRLGQLLADYAAAEVWASLTGPSAPGAWARRAAAVDLDVVRQATADGGLGFVVPGDPQWPAGLDALDRCDPVQESRGAPVGLWVRGCGDLAALVERSVAIVGSRASSAYGDHVASDLAAGLAGTGITVVSGGAYGIDAAAHRGALAVTGPTVAVVAGGLDEPYPRAHAELFERIAEVGLIVSEVAPGDHPTRRRFLTRNRLIAALTQGTVLVEAAARSGARNTASWASACGRPLMAVPGSVHSATSVTPHRLIRDGEAVLVTRTDDVRAVVGPLGAALPLEYSPAHLLDRLTPEQ